MKSQGPHGMLPKQTYDEVALESGLCVMRRYFTTELIPANRELYETRLLHTFEANAGREPASVEEVATLMNDTFHYRASSLIGRAIQELMWDTVGESIERQLDTLIENAKPKPGAKATVELDPTLQMPDYIQAVDIHCMPGNFQTELCDDDVLAGAMYDRGAYVFSYGGRGTYQDNLGRLAAQFVREKFPDLEPRRILELGCGCGVSTLPMKEVWPAAEVHGVDVAAPMLRYARGRAESLGVPIHFSQQDACATRFPDGHYDLVYSILVHHEMPLGIIQRMLRECYRLLAPGGVMIHDGKLRSEQSPSGPYQRFLAQWFVTNINEPFGQGLDLERDLQAAGIRREDIVAGSPEGNDYLKGQLTAHGYVAARKR